MSKLQFPVGRRFLAIAAVGLLLAGGAVLTPAILAPGLASSQIETSYASVSVDTTPLAASLYKPTGERLRAMIETEIGQKFAVTGDTSKPRIVVRVTDLVVPSSAGHEPRIGPINAQPVDRMDGETLIIAPDGNIIARYPVTVSAPASTPEAAASSFAIATENGVEADFRRLGQLVKSFASWSARYAGTI